ncbi:MAG TPA: ATP-dependent Clp protease adaptor ClpS [Tepidisphaeraceae bacterium]|nr:ATP-dependent Clp protease adaptor ClpS [Tepidisphaeraceae bacterium]
MADQEQAQSAAVKPKKRTAPKSKRKTRKLPPFNVVLLDDDAHTYDYVVEMLRSIFGHAEEKAFQMAKEVDTSGRVIVFTTHKEFAELKRDQIHSWGSDWRLAISKGSMSATIEPATSS